MKVLRVLHTSHWLRTLPKCVPLPNRIFMPHMLLSHFPSAGAPPTKAIQTLRLSPDPALFDINYDHKCDDADGDSDDAGQRVSMSVSEADVLGIRGADDDFSPYPVMVMLMMMITTMVIRPEVSMTTYFSYTKETKKGTTIY